MWLILCSSNDAAAHWAYQGLRSRGLAPLELVCAEALSYGLRWDHRIGAEGVHTRVELRDGRTLTVGGLRGVLNRLTYVPTQHLSMSPDHEYIAQELMAFFMSWLHALPQPVLNRPTPQGLCGQWRHASEWVLLASRAGLPTPVYQQSSIDDIDETRVARTLFPAGTPTSTAVVVGGRVFGAEGLAKEIEEGCVRLAALVSTPLLGVEFARDDAAAWKFSGATPLPDLRAGGEPLLDALAAELCATQAAAPDATRTTEALTPRTTLTHATLALEGAR